MSIIITSKRAQPIKLSFDKAAKKKKKKNQNVAEKPNMSDDVLSDDETLELEMLYIEIPELKGGKISKDTAEEEGKDEKADADGESREGKCLSKRLELEKNFAQVYYKCLL